MNFSLVILGLLFFVSVIGGLHILQTLEAGMPAQVCYIDSDLECGASELLDPATCATNCVFVPYTEDIDPDDPPPFPQGDFECDGSDEIVETTTMVTKVASTDGLVVGTTSRVPASESTPCQYFYDCKCDNTILTPSTSTEVSCEKDESTETDSPFTRIRDVGAGEVCND